MSVLQLGGSERYLFHAEAHPWHVESIGLCRDQIEVRDVVAVIPGLTTPIILRKRLCSEKKGVGTVFCILLVEVMEDCECKSWTVIVLV